MLFIQILNDFFRLFYCNTIVNSDSIVITEINYFIDEDSKKNEGFIGSLLKSNRINYSGIESITGLKN